MIINKTPHDVNIVNENNNVYFTFPPSEVPIRLKAKTVNDRHMDEVYDWGRDWVEIPISKTVFGDPEGLPEEEVGTFYIVSQLVKSALPERNDLLVPAEVVRDENGNIIGCRSLGR